MNFVLSPAGQKLWYLKRGSEGGPKQFELNRLSVRKDFYERYQSQSNLRINPYEYDKRLKASNQSPLDRRILGRRWRILNAFLHATIVLPHKDLREAWLACIQAGMPSDAVQEFQKSPLSESRLLELAATWKGDNETDVREKDAWVQFTHDKCARVIAMCRKRAAE